MSDLFQKILEARERLRDQAHVTPIVTSRTLNDLVGAEVFLKCENLQRIGAFKFRGAFNAISQLNDEEKKRGVVTFSSGNHGQAIALVAKLFNIPATIVVPSDAPTIKRAAMEGYGAKVISFDSAKTNREEITRDLQSKSGATLIPPFDHLDVIAGQGTATVEIFEEEESLNFLLVPCGGGGLISGTAVASKNICPSCRVIGVEPEVADDAARSFRTKTLQTVKNPPTIADGTRTPSLGKITFPLVLEYVDDFATVSEEAIMEAVRFCFYRLKLVVEPSGVLGLAAILSGAIKVNGRVGVILSGGNIDAATMTKILNG